MTIAFSMKRFNNYRKGYVFVILTWLFGACSGTPPEGHARAYGFELPKVIIKTPTNQYIHVDTVTNRLEATANSAAAASVFYHIDLDNGIFSLMDLDKQRYVSIDYHQGGYLHLNAPQILEWEKLKIVEQKDELLYLQSTLGAYIGVEGQSGLIAKYDNPQPSLELIYLP